MVAVVSGIPIDYYGGERSDPEEIENQVTAQATTSAPTQNSTRAWSRMFTSVQGYHNPDTRLALENMLLGQVARSVSSQNHTQRLMNSDAQLLSLYEDRSNAIALSGPDQVATLEEETVRAATLRSGHHVSPVVFAELSRCLQ
jgi:hypothetical protein